MREVTARFRKKDAQSLDPANGRQLRRGLFFEVRATRASVAIQLWCFVVTGAIVSPNKQASVPS
jgi:hypothetical protein